MQRPVYCLLLVNLVLPLVAFAQELPFKHYTSSNEINPIPSGAVTAIYQDRSGYLWIASWSGGLVRYNGRRMDIYADKDGILNTGIWAITQDRSGHLWVVLHEGARVSDRPLQLYGPGERVRFVVAGNDSLAQIPLRQATYSVTVDTRGRVWTLRENGGLLRYTPAGDRGFVADTVVMDLHPAGIRDEVYSIIASRNGDIWAAARNRKMLIFKNGGLRYTVMTSSLPETAFDVLYEGPTGAMWAGGADGSVWQLSGSHFVRVMQLSGNIRALLQEPSGVLWVGGMGTGLVRYDPKTRQTKHYTRANGLLDEYVWGLTRDREGNLWIAHMTGLSKLRVSYAAFTRYTSHAYAGAHPALPGSDAQVIVPGVPTGQSGAVLFVGTNDGASFIRPDGQSAHLDTGQGLPHNAILSACMDEHQQLWVGTLWGIARITFGSEGTPLPSLFGSASTTAFGEPVYIRNLISSGFPNYACALNHIPAAQGSKIQVPALCLGSQENVNCKMGDEWFTFGLDAGLPPEKAIYLVRVDRAGYFYVGTSSAGLFRSTRPLTLHALRAMKSDQGVVTKSILEPIFQRVPGFPEVTTTVGLWNGDEFWTATDNGIVVLEGIPLRVQTSIRLFGGKGVTTMTRTASGSIWAAINQVGLIEIDPNRRRVARVVGREDGLLDDQVMAYPSLVADDGIVYFGTSSGLSLYRPALHRKNSIPPLLAFDSLAFEESPNGRNALDARFQGLSFSDERQVRYRTRLVGFDKGWSPVTATPDLRYTNLRAFLFPRSYRFEVMAANDDGIWSTRPLQYTFKVQPAWWLRWWAMLVYVLILGSGIFGVDRLQRRRLIRQERNRAAVREKELRAEAAEERAGRLQAENERKTQELESARSLQLSMLPQTIPEHPLFELSAYMRTATEVGGDYYDFHTGDDATLTFVIGDATGHGLAAGTMVTAMKGLFTDHADEPELTIVLQRAARAIRRMRMPKLYMALALGRIRGSTLELAGAGLPPALVHRADTGIIEQVPLKGMPLGSPGVFPYHSTVLELAPGDSVLLMSDGFPELRDALGEMLGYEEAVTVFAEGSGRSADQLIAYLKERVTAWCDGASPDDDITFVALRAKTPVEEDRPARITIAIGD